MSSLAVGRGLEGLEIWLAGLFSAAELAAADLLLQLSAAKAKGTDDHEGAASSSATTSPSPPRSPTPCCDSEDLTTAEEEVEEPAVSAELDRRARKRYRRISDLYADTALVTSGSSSASASASATKKKRKRHHRRDDGFGSSVEATRYGGDY